MIIELQVRDLKPSRKWTKGSDVKFEYFVESAQRIALIAGAAIFVREGQSYPVIVPPNTSYRIESANLVNRGGRSMITIWRNGVQLVQLTVKTTLEIVRIVPRLSSSPYSFQRVVLDQPYDWLASQQAGKPIQFKGPIDSVGIYVPYSDLMALPEKSIALLFKL